MRKSSSSEVEEAYLENYIFAQYTWVQFISEYLADCSRVFRGDLQSMLILAIVGQSALASLLRAGFPGDPPDRKQMPPHTPINATSLAAISGIPRQTVRRKLAALAEKGWIEQAEDGSWRIAQCADGGGARQDLRGLEERSIKRIARVVSAFSALAMQHAAKKA